MNDLVYEKSKYLTELAVNLKRIVRQNLLPYSIALTSSDKPSSKRDEFEKTIIAKLKKFGAIKIYVVDPKVQIRRQGYCTVMTRSICAEFIVNSEKRANIITKTMTNFRNSCLA